MNKKLIAAAVSAAVIAPVAAQAESSFYGRVNTAIDLSDLTDDGTTDVSNVVSRFGFKGNADIGNGMTAHGHYEFGVNSDRESAAGGTKGTTGVDDVRIATVGLSGSFGRVDIGQQWSAYFDTFGTLISPTYTLGYYLYSSIGGAPYRASNTIKYSNSFGPVSMELDVRLNESNEGTDVAEKINGDGIGLGLSFAVTDNITVAAAFDSEDGAETAAVEATNGKPASDDYAVAAAPTINNSGVVTPGTAQVGTAAVDPTAAVPASTAPDTDRVGIAVKATFGDFWGAIGHQSYEVDDDERTSTDDEVDIDTTFVWVGGSLGEKTSWMIGYATADDATDAVAAKGAVAKVGNIGDTNYVAPAAEVDAVPAGDDSTQVTWGVYHNLGGGMKLYYEATSVDAGDNDGDRHLLGMRIDF